MQIALQCEKRVQGLVRAQILTGQLFEPAMDEPEASSGNEADERTDQ